MKEINMKSLNKTALKLRLATLSDLQILESWDTKEHVIASDPNDEWDWNTMLSESYEWQELLIAELESVPIGFIQIIDPALEVSHYWGEVGSGYRAIDIWIGDIENTGKGYGTQIMRLALERCFRCADVNTVLIDPLATNTRAIRFYERLGFRFVEDRRFGDDDCKVYAMTRRDWKI